MLKYFNSPKDSATASIIDGILVLTLPDAIRPVVWQMQLGQAKSSALEVRDSADGTYLLVIKTPRADSLEIAAFATKENAVSALLAVSRAMCRAQGQLCSYPANVNYPLPAVIPRKRSWLGILARTIGLAILFLIVVFAALSALIWLNSDSTPVAAQQAAVSAPNVSENSGGTEGSSGEPVSAEDFLNNQ